MGNAVKTLTHLPPDEDKANRRVFVVCEAGTLVNYANYFSIPSDVIIYTIQIRYQRYVWSIKRRFSEIEKLDRGLRWDVPKSMQDVSKLPKFLKICINHNERAFVADRAQKIGYYLQNLVDKEELFTVRRLRHFLEVSAASFDPSLGRKGKEGFLNKSSGGYVEKFSRKYGDYIQHSRNRWFILHDTHISWYRSPEDAKLPLGTLQITPEFRCVCENVCM